MEQASSWFDMTHLTKSSAQFNMEKMAWLNNHYIKLADNARLADLVRPILLADGAVFDGAPELSEVVALLKERANTIIELANAAMLFYGNAIPDSALISTHLNEITRPALLEFLSRVNDVSWDRSSINAMIKEVLAVHKLKMPQLAMPLRLMVTGQLQTPSIDAVLELFGREVVKQRMAKYF